MNDLDNKTLDQTSFAWLSLLGMESAIDWSRIVPFGITPKASGLAAPIGVNYNTVTFTTAQAAALACKSYADTSANTANSSLTDAVNYTGSGVCDFLAHFAAAGVAGQFTVVVDGVTVLDFNPTANLMYGVIGSVTLGATTITLAADTAIVIGVPGTPIYFRKSFQVQHRVASGVVPCYTLLRMHKIT